MTENQNTTQENGQTAESSNGIKEVIKSFRTRSKSLTRKANLFLFIGLIFIVGVLYFFYIQPADSEKQLANSIVQFSNTVNSSFELLNTATTNYREQLSTQATELKRLETQSDKPLIFNVQSFNERFDIFIKQVEIATKSTERFSNLLEKTNASVIALPENIIRARNGGIDWSLISIRIGVVVLVIFAIQILLGLYKYNTKLSAFYDARADGLELLRTENNFDYEKLIKMISPEAFDFDSPRSPIDSVLEFARSYNQNKVEPNPPQPQSTTSQDNQTGDNTTSTETTQNTNS